jgi:hypothetical protein
MQDNSLQGNARTPYALRRNFFEQISLQLDRLYPVLQALPFQNTLAYRMHPEGVLLGGQSGPTDPPEKPVPACHRQTSRNCAALMVRAIHSSDAQKNR